MLGITDILFAAQIGWWQSCTPICAVSDGRDNLKVLRTYPTATRSFEEIKSGNEKIKYSTKINLHAMLSNCTRDLLWYEGIAGSDKQYYCSRGGILYKSVFKWDDTIVCITTLRSPCTHFPTTHVYLREPRLKVSQNTVLMLNHSIRSNKSYRASCVH